ncbi:MAG: ABC transporter ATP-binding protein [Proteobacteria bacterium]|nr:MAG: ABC transporter ATP-binding protein [Pseudomonadota bacterium]
MGNPESLDAAVMLEVRGIEVLYDSAILALRGVSLDVHGSRIVSLLGANGAGKTTTLKAISGLLQAERGAIVSGTVTYRDRRINEAPPAELVSAGLVQVLEGRHCFSQLTVEENLLSGALLRRLARTAQQPALERIYHYFPRLASLRRKAAGYTSGGEQQMVAIGRALMSQPKLVLLDEPSMGLGPQMVEEIFEIVRELNRQDGVSFLLAEQNATMALRYAHHGYILENGKVVADGSAQSLSARADVQQFYLGVGDQGRKSFRGVRYHPAAAT